MSQAPSIDQVPARGLLAEKVIVITGASTGIGADAARLFAREGAVVVLGARSEDRLAELTDELTAMGAEATYTAMDVSRADDAQRLIDSAGQHYGRLDGAFNNAGISQGGGALADIDEDTFDRVLAVNLKGVWLAMRAEIKTVLSSGSGAIVNTSSVGGLRGGQGLATYLATKHGVIGLTRGAAHDYGRYGLRVNAIAPGTTLTPMMQAWYERDPEVGARLDAATPMRRGGQPMEIAQGAAWLLSDSASYVNGAVLPIDGGMTA
jgi:NAD(P)-dependent dehydrogenase (short-subunit alcohol dehydrogenase family)